MKIKISRRNFLASLGLSFLLSSDFYNLAEATDRDITLYASAYMDKQNLYGVAILNQDGHIVSTFPLPDRGHSIASTKTYQLLVTFARRPSNFALAIDLAKRNKPVLFKSPSHSHFYGHGVFSHDGKLLFATENKFDSGKGMIGIYDTTNGFTRIGDFPSYGIGPHEIIMMPDSHTLCVANGGILTHPDTGRTKLNLHEMQSSVVFINSSHGNLIAKFDVPKSIQHLSLRHMAIDHKNTVWLGGQYEGNKSDIAPLIATINTNTGLEFPDITSVQELELANYVGSVASNVDGRKIAFSSPKSNILVVIDANKKILTHKKKIPNVCGIASSQEGFLTTSYSGEINQYKNKVYWDNHVTRV